MKKMLLLVPAVAFAAGLSAVEIISIDSMAIMQQSTEGQQLAEKVKKEINSFQEEVQSTQKELADKQEALSKQAKVLSAEAMQEKQAELVKKSKSLERDFAEKQEALRLKIQKWHVALRDKQLKTVNKFSAENSWPMVIDKNTPGVLFVSEALDKTDAVLVAVNKAYAADKISTKVAAKTDKATTKTA